MCSTCTFIVVLTPFVIANGDEDEDTGRLSLSSSPRDLGRDPVDFGRELPLVPGFACEW